MRAIRYRLTFDNRVFLFVLAAAQFRHGHRPASVNRMFFRPVARYFSEIVRSTVNRHTHLHPRGCAMPENFRQCHPASVPAATGSSLPSMS